MRIEIASAANFLVDLLRLSNANLTESQLAKFRENVCECLVRHYRDHWFPETPVKGSGYRCIRINGKMDPLISRAGVMMGIAEKFLRSLFPSELTMWVDPSEVSYRIGENGSICVLYEDDISSSASSSPVSSSSESSPPPSKSTSMGSPSTPRQPNTTQPQSIAQDSATTSGTVSSSLQQPQPHQLQSVVAMSNSPHQGHLPSALPYTPSKGVVQVTTTAGTQSPPPPPPPPSSSNNLQHQQQHHHLLHHQQVSGMLSAGGGVLLKDTGSSSINCKESLQRSMANLNPRLLMLDRLSTYVSS